MSGPVAASAATRQASFRPVRAQWALLGCVFLGLFTEVLLSPFYPQFFSKVFGIHDYTYTGMYIFVCRLAVVLCSPLWGLLSKRFDAKRLLFVGQAGTAVGTALLATATSAEAFLILTVVLLLFKSSYMLIYPLMIELTGRDNNAAAASKFHAVYHTAIIVSTLTGAWMLGLDAPLKLFYGAAVVDAIQLALCVWALRGSESRRRSAIEAQQGLRESAVSGSGEAGAPSPFEGTGADAGQAEAAHATEGQTAGAGAHKGRTEAGEAPAPRGLARFRQSGVLLLLGTVFLTVTLANNIIRPFFTRYAENAFGLSAVWTSGLFLLPSVMAVLAMPLIRRVCVPGRLLRVYAIGMLVMAAGLAIQGSADTVTALVIGRIAYGLFVAITLAALDVALFEQSKDSRIHFHFSVIVSFQNIAELLSPLLASALVERAGLHVPLQIAALLCLLSLALFWFGPGRQSVRPAKQQAVG